MTENMKNSLRFVTRFYSPGTLRPDPSFIREGLPFRKRHAAAASIIGTALLAAAAVTTYLALAPSPPTEASAPQTETPVTPAEETPKTENVRKMKFDDASLPDVVKAIEKEYGVKVSGQTEGQPRLTLSYEGSAEDLIGAINDLLGTNLKIEK